ncbi:hypothetical protein NMY22_g17652 [Coprinellus aureogranulatus]|nr:hypothetical protein NMY22_g17652 [Coprinellus aureogranulatus]
MDTNLQKAEETIGWLRLELHCHRLRDVKFKEMKDQYLKDLKRLGGDRDEVNQEREQLDLAREVLRECRERLDDEREVLQRIHEARAELATIAEVSGRDTKELQAEINQLKSIKRDIDEEKEHLAFERREIAEARSKLATALEALEHDQRYLQADLDKLEAQQKEVEDGKAQVCEAKTEMEVAREALEIAQKELHAEQAELKVQEKVVEYERGQLAFERGEFRDFREEIEGELDRLRIHVRELQRYSTSLEARLEERSQAVLPHPSSIGTITADGEEVKTVAQVTGRKAWTWDSVTGHAPETDKAIVKENKFTDLPLVTNTVRMDTLDAFRNILYILSCIIRLASVIADAYL